MVEAQLYSALPVPSASVPMYEVLAFRSTREAELQALRGAMDDFYHEVVSSADARRSEEVLVRRIDQSLADLETVMAEARIDRFLANLEVNLFSRDFVEELALATVLGLVAGSSIGLSLLGAAAGCGASALRVGVKSAMVPKVIPDHLLDFSYAYQVGRNLGEK